jgi:hypothetical protein
MKIEKSLDSSLITIFLDIDGTMIPEMKDNQLIHEEFSTAYPGVDRCGKEQVIPWRKIQSEHYDKDAVQCLNTLIHHCEFLGKKVQIIVSAAARTSCDTIGQLQELFGKHAFAKYVSGKTPNNATVCREDRCSPGLCRGGEIYTYLTSHPEVDNYIAIDDCTTHFEKNGIIHVDVGRVLTISHLSTIQKILKLLPIAPILHPVHSKQIFKDEEEAQFIPHISSPLIIFLEAKLREKASPFLDDLKRGYKNRRVVTIMPLITTKMAWNNWHAVTSHIPDQSPFPWIQYPTWTPRELSIIDWMQRHHEIDDVIVIANEVPSELRRAQISEEMLDTDESINRPGFSQSLSSIARKILYQSDANLNS